MPVNENENELFGEVLDRARLCVFFFRESIGRQEAYILNYTQRAIEHLNFCGFRNKEQQIKTIIREYDLTLIPNTIVCLVYIFRVRML